MTGFAGWVGGHHTYDEMKRQLKLMGSYIGNKENQSVYLPVGAMIAPNKHPVKILQNGTASIALVGEIYLQHKRMPKLYRLSMEEILEAYLQQGAQCLNTFQGEFALGIILAEHNEVFLASDHFGTTPIYYSQQEGHFVFSTHMTPLLNHMAVNPKLSNQAVFDYLYHHFIPSPKTIYKDIARVQAGYYVLHRKNQTLSVPYWQSASFPKKNFSFSRSKTRLKEVLSNAVNKFEKANIGAFLSGGLDSSTIAGLMSEQYSSPIKAFTIGFDQDKYDESEYAALVAKHFGLIHHHQNLGAKDLLREIPKIVQNMEQPFGNSSLIGAYFCAKLAKDHGIDCLLAGDGGDELFGGNNRYQTHYWYNKYRNIPKLFRMLAAEGWANILSDDAPIPMLKKAKKFIALSKLSVIQRESKGNLLNTIGFETLFEQSFLNEIDSHSPLTELLASYHDAQGKSWLNKLLCMDFKWILADNDIQKVRIACESHQVQVHFPMLDPSVVRFAMKLPDNYKVGKHGLRSFYKKAFNGWLPKELMNKPKHGFGVPFGPWVLKNQPLREFTFDTLQELKNRNIIQSNFIDNLTNNLISEHPGFYGVLLWDLLALELWLQSHPLSNTSYNIDSIKEDISQYS